MIERIKVASSSHEQLRDITAAVNDVLHRSRVQQGICHIFVPHTTAGLIVNENADPDVCRDILEWLESAVPSAGPFHHAEGNAPAHIKASLVGQSASIPVEGGRLALGTWQGVYLAEFDGPRQRTVIISVAPSTGSG